MTYRIGDTVAVNDRMQSGYSYKIEALSGRKFDQDFNPHFSPKVMLELGVFEGKYCNDCVHEFPQSWYRRARISETANPSLNWFGIKSRQSLSDWCHKGWIIGPDPRGWFQWYCRYYLGRRIPRIDNIQIKRWKSFVRHQAQVRRNCVPGDLSCRPRQRQALLQWSYDPFI